MCVCIYMCVSGGGGCVDKYISAATWLSKQKFLAPPLKKRVTMQRKDKQLEGKSTFTQKRNRKLSLRSFERSTLEIENSFCSTNTWELHIDLESQISQVL